MQEIKALKLLFIFILFSISLSIAQTNIPETRQRVIYKTFQEFVDNSSSVKDSFLIEYVVISNVDTSIVDAKFMRLDSSSFKGHMWGFSDGMNVYVRFPQSLFNNEKCSKLKNIGHYYVFTAIEKSGAAIGPGILTRTVIHAVTRALLPKNTVTYIIDDAGRVRYLNEDILRKYLKEFPSLLASFNKDFDKIFPKEFYDGEHYVTDEQEFKKMELLKDYLLKLDSAKTLKIKNGL